MGWLGRSENHPLPQVRPRRCAGLHRPQVPNAQVRGVRCPHHYQGLQDQMPQLRGYAGLQRSMRALDLFCGGGGTCAGLLAAGFDRVVGIDINPHHHYPGDFIQADATNPPVRLEDFDFIWASPPCQKYTAANVIWPNHTRKLKDFIGPTRELLKGHPVTCIENVPMAPIRPDIKLTGGMFGLDVIRRRHFEISWFVLTPQMQLHRRGAVLRGEAVTVLKSRGSCNKKLGPIRRAKGLPGGYTLKEKADAMGTTHPMTHSELGEAVPPAYARYIGELAIKEINRC